jgi:8-oxo-dGTP diphosphatase
LGIEVEVGAPFEITSHAYPEKRVLLLFFEARRKPGSPEPRALDVADLQWADLDALATLTFPPADVAVVERIRARLTTRE